MEAPQKVTGSVSDIATFVDIVELRSERSPDRLAFRYLADGEREEQLLTYSQLNRKARSVAAWLGEHGARGERVLLLYPPGLDFIVGFLGCLYAGAIAVPAYPPVRSRMRDRDRPLKHIADDCQAAVVLTTSKLQPTIQPMLDDGVGGGDSSTLRWICTDLLSDGDGDSWVPLKLLSNQIAFLQYTSGSTASPRGVIVTHDNLLQNSAMIRSVFGVSEETIGVSWLPPYHDMGLIGGILQPLFAGFPVTLFSPYSFMQQPIRWLQAISTYRATVSGGPNFAFDQCVHRVSPEQCASLDLSCWKVAPNGAEPVRRETLKRFTDTFSRYGFRRGAFFPCYGLAEATLLVSGRRDKSEPSLQAVNQVALGKGKVVPVREADPSARILVSSGATADGIDAIVVNGETRRRCSPDQIGEIWISSRAVAKGYWMRPEDTQAVFQARLADSNAGPFLRTGDLGFVTDGDLFVTGRVKDLIIVRGRNHYPQDIELTIEQAHRGIRPASTAVFSVDMLHAEEVVAVAEVEREHLEEPTAEMEAAMRLAVLNIHGLNLYRVLLVPAGTVPKTTSGKIRRHACRDLVACGHPGPLDQGNRFQSPGSPLTPVSNHRPVASLEDAAELPRKSA